MAVAALQSQQAGAEQKVAKLDARYQDHPNGTQHCTQCEYRVTRVFSKLVRGQASPNGWYLLCSGGVVSRF